MLQHFKACNESNYSYYQDLNYFNDCGIYSIQDAISSQSVSGQEERSCQYLIFLTILTVPYTNCITVFLCNFTKQTCLLTAPVY